MKRPTLQMNRGLQASGKTTASMELVAQGWKRVNKDDLRYMIDNKKWSKENENIIKGIETTLVQELLGQGFNVVVDDTNFVHEDHWKAVAINCNSQFVVRDFDTPVQECVRRNLLRGEPVPTDAIWKMYRQHVQPTIKSVPYEKNLPDCYLFDIDGTLAHMKKRGPFDEDRVDEDSLDEPTANILDVLSEKNKIFILSGRSSACRTKTFEWLTENGITFEELYMRDSGDKRPDTDVKREIYENNIKGKYNVLGIFDDRDSVVQLWRSLGLKCFQCEYGSF